MTNIIKHKEYLLPLAIIALGLIFSIVNIALAQSIALTENDVIFPVQELGGCASKQDCKKYCDGPDNMQACIDFAEKYNLMDKEEINQARKFSEVKKGPGGCKNKTECEVYCNDISRINECIAFGEKHGIMPEKELKEAKKIQAVINSGVSMPGGCKTKRECDAYCESPNHMQECIDFSINAGVMPPNEVEDAKKMLVALKKGIKPPACDGPRECEAYCMEPENFNECIAFAEAAGFIGGKEAKLARKVGAFTGPGGCKGKECDAFCEKEENLNTCIDFAVEMGEMTKEEAEMIKKTGGKGPGGCKGKNECDTFCEKEENQEVCMKFGEEHGLIRPEDKKRMEEGKREMQKILTESPIEALACFKEKLGVETFEKAKTGQVAPSHNFFEKLEPCFKLMRPGMMSEEEKQRFEEGKRQMKEFLTSSPEITQCAKEKLGPDLIGRIISGEASPEPKIIIVIDECSAKLGIHKSGPGGCQTPEECDVFCKENPKECGGPDGPGGPPPGFPEECMEYPMPDKCMVMMNDMPPPPENFEKPGMFEKIRDFGKQVFERPERSDLEKMSSCIPQEKIDAIKQECSSRGEKWFTEPRETIVDGNNCVMEIFCKNAREEFGQFEPRQEHFEERTTDKMPIPHEPIFEGQDSMMFPTPDKIEQIREEVVEKVMHDTMQRIEQEYIQQERMRIENVYMEQEGLRMENMYIEPAGQMPYQEHEILIPENVQYEMMSPEYQMPPLEMDRSYYPEENTYPKDTLESMTPPPPPTEYYEQPHYIPPTEQMPSQETIMPSDNYIEPIHDTLPPPDENIYKEPSAQSQFKELLVGLITKTLYR